LGTTEDRKIHWPLIAAGVMVSLFGVLVWADRIDHRTVVFPHQLWPMFLLVIGAVVIGGGRGREELRKGMILLAVGLWLLVNTLDIGGLDFGGSWPLLLILIGLAITFSPSGGRRVCRSGQGPLLILWGSLAWIAMHQLWGLTWGTVWPLLVVAIGLSIVWRAIVDQRPRTHPDSTGEDDVEPTL